VKRSILATPVVLALLSSFCGSATASMMSAVEMTLSTNSKVTITISASSGTITTSVSTQISGTIMSWVGCHEDPMFGHVPDLISITSADITVSDASLTVNAGDLGSLFGLIQDVKINATGPHLTGTTIGTGKAKFDFGGTTLSVIDGYLTYEGEGTFGSLAGTGEFDFGANPESAELPTGSTLTIMQTPTVDPEKFIISVNLPVNIALEDIITNPVEVDGTIIGLFAASGIKMITIAPPCIAGDVDCDGDVDFQDFLLLQVGYGTTSGADRSDGDLDDDQDVDFQDFLVLQANYGNTSDALGAGGDASSAVPEPGTVILLAFGLAGLVPILRRRLRRR